MVMKVLPGKPYPLGATWTGEGVNFALYSEHATEVDLCLFDSPSASGEKERITLSEVAGYVWHCFIPGIQSGQLYGYRVHGPWNPEAGLRFNPSKLLIDPYAKALAGKLNYEAPVFGYIIGHNDADLSRSDEDDAWGVPKCVVVSPYFDWEEDRSPRVP